jgi:hypothetical protein
MVQCSDDLAVPQHSTVPLLMPCVSNGTLTVCYPGRQERIRHESRGERYCFRCRKSREFFYDIWVEIEPSYYATNPSIVCGTCNLTDGDLFPGRFREWE